MPLVSGCLTISKGLTSIAVDARAIDRPSFIGKRNSWLRHVLTELPQLQEAADIGDLLPFDYLNITAA